MKIEEMFYAEDATKKLSTKPMALAIMQTVLPEVAVRIVNRRFGLDGKAPLSTEQVALRYGLPVGVINSVLFASMNTLGDLAEGLDTTP